MGCAHCTSDLKSFVALPTTLSPRRHLKDLPFSPYLLNFSVHGCVSTALGMSSGLPTRRGRPSNAQPPWSHNPPPMCSAFRTPTFLGLHWDRRTCGPSQII